MSNTSTTAQMLNTQEVLWMTREVAAQVERSLSIWLRSMMALSDYTIIEFNLFGGALAGLHLWDFNNKGNVSLLDSITKVFKKFGCSQSHAIDFWKVVCCEHATLRQEIQDDREEE